MRVLIIEDEGPAAERLIRLLQTLEPDIVTDGPLDTVSAAVNHLSRQSDYDLLFLDIQLADGKSFSIFDAIPLRIPVIFTTAYDAYAIKAFDLHSIDYLLKPVNINKLRDAMDKYITIRDYYQQSNPNKQLFELISSIQENKTVVRKDRFLVSKADMLIPVKTSEIACFYAEEKVVFLLTHDKQKFIINHSVEEIAELVDPAHFFRVNRQFIVAAEAIRKVHNYFNFKLKVELSAAPDLEIIVSRLKCNAFKEWLNH
jgi:DNA-binding LytR/AlgR family response regulator